MCNFFKTLKERENKEELKTMLKEALKEKSDLFNCENPEEDKVFFSFFPSFNVLIVIMLL